MGDLLRPEAGDLRTTFKLAPFETNSHGMRDDEVALEKPDGVFRVAFLGDSFVMGSGVRHAELFHTLLEQRWSAASEGVQYECLNFGVGGYGLRTYAAVLRHRALRFDPDLVVVCLTANDRQRPFHRPPNGTYVEKPLEHPFFELHVTRPLRRFGERSGPVRSSELEARERYGLAMLGALREDAEAAGVPLVVVYLSMGIGEDARPAGKESREWSREVGVPYFDTTVLFRGLGYDELAIFPDDRHPNARAQVLFATGVDRFLRRRGVLGGGSEGSHLGSELGWRALRARGFGSRETCAAELRAHEGAATAAVAASSRGYGRCAGWGRGDLAATSFGGDDKGPVVLGINQEDDVETEADLARTRGLPFAVLLGARKVYTDHGVEVSRSTC